MSTLTISTISLVIVLQVLFLILEMFLWNKPFGRKMFGLTEAYASQSAPLAANQGLYNGFLAAGLLWGLLSTDGNDTLIFFLSCIIIAGIYGAYTVKLSILWVQAFPAAIALTFLVFNR